MGALMVRKKNPKVTDHDKITLKVKLLRDTVKLYMRKTEQSLQYEQDLAIQLVQRGLRDRAKCILRKQVALIEHLKVTDRQLETLEDTINALETTGLQAKIFEGLRAGNLALRRAHEVLNIKNVELILEETVQAIEKQEEINRMVTVLDAAKSEESLNSDLDRELENLTEKTGPAVVVSTDSTNHVTEKAKERTPQERSIMGRFKKKLPPAEVVTPKPSTSTAAKEKKKRKKSSKSSKKTATVSYSRTKEPGIAIYN